MQRNQNSLLLSFPSEENEIVPQVLQAVLSLPDTTHVALRYTSTQLVGELGEWIEVHPQYLGKPRYRYFFQIPLVNDVTRNCMAWNFSSKFNILFLRSKNMWSILEAIVTFADFWLR